LATWPEEIDNTEKCKRILDLFLVSVLLDAGAGTEWSYKSVENGRIYRRSEGIAVATLDMFKTVGLLSPRPASPLQPLLIFAIGALFGQQQQVPG
jgi:hypothetical protein